MFFLWKGDFLLLIPLACYTKPCLQVIADLWERYMELLDQGVGDGYALDLLACDLTTHDDTHMAAHTVMLWTSSDARDIAAGEC
jgi:DNA-directed RNA polymerase subunit N (RpoN/RPB10)